MRSSIWLLVAACSGGGNATPDSSSDAPDSDAAVDTPTAACTAAYCDDFESDPSGPLTNGGALGPFTVKINGTVALAAIDGVKPYHGAHALHITIAPGTAAGATLTKLAAGGVVSGNNLFGRAMVYFSNAGGNAAPINVHSWLFQALGTSTASGGPVSLNWGDGGTQMQLNYHPFNAPETSIKDAPQMTAGAWHCVQWQYDGSGTPPANVAKVWVDGSVAVAAPASKGWQLATPWNAFNFGFMHYQTLATGVDVYLDDFAVDGAMLDCP